MDNRDTDFKECYRRHFGKRIHGSSSGDGSESSDGNSELDEEYHHNKPTSIEFAPVMCLVQEQEPSVFLNNGPSIGTVKKKKRKSRKKKKSKAPAEEVPSVNGASNDSHLEASSNGNANGIVINRNPLLEHIENPQFDASKTTQGISRKKKKKKMRVFDGLDINFGPLRNNIAKTPTKSRKRQNFGFKLDEFPALTAGPSGAGNPIAEYSGSSASESLQDNCECECHYQWICTHSDSDDLSFQTTPDYSSTCDSGSSFATADPHMDTPLGRNTRNNFSDVDATPDSNTPNSYFDVEADSILTSDCNTPNSISDVEAELQLGQASDKNTPNCSYAAAYAPNCFSGAGRQMNFISDIPAESNFFNAEEVVVVDELLLPLQTNSLEDIINNKLLEHVLIKDGVLSKTKRKQRKSRRSKRQSIDLDGTINSVKVERILTMANKKLTEAVNNLNEQIHDKYGEDQEKNRRPIWPSVDSDSPINSVQGEDFRNLQRVLTEANEELSETVTKLNEQIHGGGDQMEIPGSKTELEQDQQTNIDEQNFANFQSSIEDESATCVQEGRGFFEDINKTSVDIEGNVTMSANNSANENAHGHNMYLPIVVTQDNANKLEDVTNKMYLPIVATQANANELEDVTKIATTVSLKRKKLSKTKNKTPLNEEICVDQKNETPPAESCELFPENTVPTLNSNLVALSEDVKETVDESVEMLTPSAEDVNIPVSDAQGDKVHVLTENPQQNAITKNPTAIVEEMGSAGATNKGALKKTSPKKKKLPKVKVNAEMTEIPLNMEKEWERWVDQLMTGQVTSSDFLLEFESLSTKSLASNDLGSVEKSINNDNDSVLFEHPHNIPDEKASIMDPALSENVEGLIKHKKKNKKKNSKKLIDSGANGLHLQSQIRDFEFKNNKIDGVMELKPIRSDEMRENDFENVNVPIRDNNNLAQEDEIYLSTVEVQENTDKLERSSTSIITSSNAVEKPKKSTGALNISKEKKLPKVKVIAEVSGQSEIPINIGKEWERWVDQVITGQNTNNDILLELDSFGFFKHARDIPDEKSTMDPALSENVDATIKQTKKNKKKKKSKKPIDSGVANGNLNLVSEIVGDLEPKNNQIDDTLRSTGSDETRDGKSPKNTLLLDESNFLEDKIHLSILETQELENINKLESASSNAVEKPMKSARATNMKISSKEKKKLPKSSVNVEVCEDPKSETIVVPRDDKWKRLIIYIYSLLGRRVTENDIQVALDSLTAKQVPSNDLELPVNLEKLMNDENSTLFAESVISEDAGLSENVEATVGQMKKNKNKKKKSKVLIDLGVGNGNLSLEAENCDSESTSNQNQKKKTSSETEINESEFGSPQMTVIEEGTENEIGCKKINESGSGDAAKEGMKSKSSKSKKLKAACVASVNNNGGETKKAIHEMNGESEFTLPPNCVRIINDDNNDSVVLYYDFVENRLVQRDKCAEPEAWTTKMPAIRKLGPTSIYECDANIATNNYWELLTKETTEDSLLEIVHEAEVLVELTKTVKTKPETDFEVILPNLPKPKQRQASADTSTVEFEADTSIANYSLDADIIEDLFFGMNNPEMMLKPNLRKGKKAKTKPNPKIFNPPLESTTPDTNALDSGPSTMLEKKAKTKPRLRNINPPLQSTETTNSRLIATKTNLQAKSAKEIDDSVNKSDYNFLLRVPEDIHAKAAATYWCKNRGLIKLCDDLIEAAQVPEEESSEGTCSLFPFLDATTNVVRMKKPFSAKLKRCTVAVWSFVSSFLPH